MPVNTSGGPEHAATLQNLLLWISAALFTASLVYCFYLLESDPLPVSQSGTSFGDAMAFAHSARLNYLNGVWYRPDMDDWRPVFMVPIHTFLTWLGFCLQGLTLTGLRLFSFIFIALAKLAALWLIWREFRSVRYLAAGMVILAIYAPLNEMTRIGALDSTQLGLFMLSVACLIAAANIGSRLLYFLVGAICGLTFIFKTSALLWPLFPYAFYYFRAKLNGHLSAQIELSPQRLRLLVWLRMALVFVPSMLFLLDHFITNGRYTLHAALLAWPLLPIAYFELSILAGLEELRRNGTSAWRALFGWWLAANALACVALTVSLLFKGPGPSLLLLRNLLPFLAIAYLILRTAVFRGWSGLWAGNKTAVLWTHIGLVVAGALGLAFWIIPNLDGIIYFSWRMFGPQAHLVMPADSGLLLNHALAFFDHYKNPSLSESIRSFQGLWVFGCLGWTALLSITRRKSYSDLEIAFSVMLGLFFFQCIFFDMHWHRFYGLMVMGLIGLCKLAQAAMGWRELELAERITPLRALLLGFALFIMGTRYLLPISFANQTSQFLALAATVMGAWLAGMALRQRRGALVPVMALAGLALLPSAVHQAWLFAVNPTFVIRQASLEAGRLIGESRVIGFYEYGLYNRTETGYVGNFRGQVKPAGFTWEGRKVASLAQAVKSADQGSLQARVLLLLDRAYPGFLDRWELPPDYERRFHSSWLVSPPGRLSPTYLVIGASEDRVFMQDTLLARFARFTVTPPPAAGEVIELPLAPHLIEEQGGMAGEEKPPVLRLVRLLANPVR